MGTWGFYLNKVIDFSFNVFKYFVTYFVINHKVNVFITFWCN